MKSSVKNNLMSHWRNNCKTYLLEGESIISIYITGAQVKCDLKIVQRYMFAFLEYFNYFNMVWIIIGKRKSLYLRIVWFYLASDPFIASNNSPSPMCTRLTSFELRF